MFSFEKWKIFSFPDKYSHDICYVHSQLTEPTKCVQSPEPEYENFVWLLVDFINFAWFMIPRIIIATTPCIYLYI